MRIKEGVAYLIIHEVVERDKGVYTCEASNQYGRVATSAELYLAGCLQDMNIHKLINNILKICIQ